MLTKKASVIMITNYSKISISKKGRFTIFMYCTILDATMCNFITFFISKNKPCAAIKVDPLSLIVVCI